MTYLVSELVTRSWYLSSIVARGLETVSGDQMTDGLNMLNAVLAIKAADQRLIPYFEKYDFNSVVGQEKYEILNLVLPQTLVFYLSSVRYSMARSISRIDYQGSARAEDVQSLPYQYYCERENGVMQLYMYFLPDQVYPFTLWGKFSYQAVSLFQDLSLKFEQYYIEYLRYALAEYMCQEYGISFKPQNMQQLNKYEKQLINVSPIDFTLRKVSSMQRGNTLNYGQVNIGKGYTA